MIENFLPEVRKITNQGQKIFNDDQWRQSKPEQKI